MVTATGSTDSFIQDSSTLSTKESTDSDSLSVPDNDTLDASIVSDDEEFAEGYFPEFNAHFLQRLFGSGILFVNSRFK